MQSGQIHGESGVLPRRRNAVWFGAAYFGAPRAKNTTLMSEERWHRCGAFGVLSDF